MVNLQHFVCDLSLGRWLPAVHWGCGRVIDDMEPKDRDIAMVFQGYALYPHVTVYDNAAFGLKLRKVPKMRLIKK